MRSLPTVRYLVLAACCGLVLTIAGQGNCQADETWDYTGLYQCPASGNTEPRNPRGTLVLDGTKLYGVSFSGAAAYSINTDGSGVFRIHAGALGNPNDGAQPWSGPLLLGDHLYGTYPYGGSLASSTPFSLGSGCVYRVKTDSTGFTIIHSFLGGVNDGTGPQCSPVLVGSYLYGTASGGGSNNLGVVWRMDTNGNNFAVLHHFMGGNDDGEKPVADSLAVDGSVLFGTCSRGKGPGGVNPMGTAWRINTDGTGYTNLHGFAQGLGYSPQAHPVLYGSRLYGTCWAAAGGTKNGTVWSMNTDGSDFLELHTFPDPGVPNDGKMNQPSPSVSFANGKLFGWTQRGGENDLGVLFSIDPSAGGPSYGYTILHHFGGTDNADGAWPYNGALVASPDGRTLYGVTYKGDLGSGTNQGILFKLEKPEEEVPPAGTVITLR